MSQGHRRRSGRSTKRFSQRNLDGPDHLLSRRPRMSYLLSPTLGHVSLVWMSLSIAIGVLPDHNCGRSSTRSGNQKGSPPKSRTCVPPNIRRCVYYRFTSVDQNDIFATTWHSRSVWLARRRPFGRYGMTGPNRRGCGLAIPIASTPHSTTYHHHNLLPPLFVLTGNPRYHQQGYMFSTL